MKVITIALGVFVPIYIHTHAGLRSHRQPKYVELAETVDLGRWEFIRRVVLPGALPGFLLGLRFAVTARVAGAGRRRADQRHQRHRLHDGRWPVSTARPT